MSKLIILTPTGMFKGNSFEGYQYFQIGAKDKEGNTYVLTFGFKEIYQESIEKSLSRLIGIEAPEEDTTILEDTDGKKLDS